MSIRGWAASATFAALLCAAAIASARPLPTGISRAWKRLTGPPVDPCLGPIYEINVNPHETLSATSDDGLVYWSVMVGDRGLEATACYSNHTQLFDAAPRIKDDLTKSAFAALRQATRELMVELFPSQALAQSQRYLDQLTILKRDLQMQLPAMIAAERRRNPQFPKNTPLIHIQRPF